MVRNYCPADQIHCPRARLRENPRLLSSYYLYYIAKPGSLSTGESGRMLAHVGMAQLDPFPDAFRTERRLPTAAVPLIRFDKLTAADLCLLDMDSVCGFMV